MVVSIALFKLKKLTLLPKFLKLSKKIYQESLDSKGNISSELDNEGIKVFYSFTHWETTEDMLAFVHSKTHKAVLKETEQLCKEAQFLIFNSSETVSLKEAKEKLLSSANTRKLLF